MTTVAPLFVPLLLLHLPALHRPLPWPRTWLPLPGSSSLLVSPPEDLAVDRALLEEAVAPALEQQGLPGAVVAVTQGDEIVALEAFGLADVASAAPLRTDHLFLVGSVTKCFTATLLALLEESGVLSVDDPVGMYLDLERELPAWVHDVTVRQVATHTSGLPREPVNRRNVPGSPSVMLPYSRAELYEGLRETRLEAEPGARWSYSNLGYALLGEVLENASGASYEELLRDRILDPLGMSESGILRSPEQEARLPSGYWHGDDSATARAPWKMGEVVSFGGLCTSARDLARFVAAQTAEGEGALLSPEARALLHTPVLDLPGTTGRRMAFGWFLQSLPGAGDAIAAGGEVDSFSAVLFLLPGPRVGVLVLCNRGGDSAELVSRSVMEKVLPLVSR